MTFIVELASSNQHFYSNAASNDVLLRMTKSNSKLHIGSSTNGAQSIASFDPSGILRVAGRIDATEIAIGGTVVITSNATSLISGGAGGTSSQWTNNGSSVYLMGSNVGIGVDTPISALQVAGDVLPGSNITYDLGSSNLRWRDLYLSGSTINLGDTRLSVDSNNNVTIRDTASNLKRIIVDEIQIGDHATGQAIIINKNPTTGTVNFVTQNINGSSNVAEVTDWKTSTLGSIYTVSNVGIGISTPAAALQVVGKSIFNGDMSIPGALNLGGLYISRRTGSNMNITSTAGQQFLSGATGLGLPSGCNLGVGTTSPLYPLDVAGDINFTGTLRQNGVPFQSASSSTSSQFSNTNSNVFLLSSNLGIKTSTPAYPLDVVGDINLTGTLRQNGSPYVGSQFSNTSSNVYLLSSNLGIGTSSPEAPLHVVGKTILSGDVIMPSTIQISGISLTASSSDASNTVGVESRPFTASASNVYMTGSNLGINTTTPQAPLHVEGTTIVRKLTILAAQ